MSTIGSLLALASDPGITPWNDIVKSSTQAQTGLRNLADLKQKQASEAFLMERIQNDPELRQRLFGDGSVIGSLQTAPGGPPGGGPMTQQSVLPGQPPGAPQVVPGGQDLSQFATQGQPGTPVLSTLGGQPQGPQQAPQNPALEMARTNPRVALMIQQQIEGRQDADMKRKEQRLDMGVKVMEWLGRGSQGVKSQADLDAFRQQAQEVSPQAAAQLPQFYSKEGMAPFIEKAVSVKDSMLLQVEENKAQAALLKARREQANIPNYTGDPIVDGLIYTKMKDQPAGTMPSPEIVNAAIKEREDTLLKRSERQGVIAAEIERTEKPLEGEAGKAVSDLTTLRKLSDDVAALRHDDYSGPVVGRTGYLREQAGTMGQQETAFRATIKNMTDILARLRSGAAIPPDDMSRLEALVPSVNDHPETFKTKLQTFQRAVEQQRETRLQVGTTGRGQLREETKPTTPRVGEQPASQPSTDTGPATFDRADFLKWRQGAGKSGNPTQADVEAYFQAKGLKRR